MLETSEILLRFEPVNPPIRQTPKWAAAFCCAVAAIFLPVAALAQLSKAHIVVDSRTGKILEGRNYDDKLPVASLTKIVSACVVLDWTAARNSDNTALITVPQVALEQGGTNPLGLRAGDRISIRDALTSSLMASDNVAIYALAQSIGTEMWQADGGRAKSAVEFFIAQMNLLARARGMTRSKFLNPHGLDHDRNRGFSTAADMVKITVYALNKPAFNFIVSQQQREVSILRGREKRGFRIHNTNTLVSRADVDGVKTGRTTRAGDCLVTSARKPDKIQKLDGNRQLRTPYHLIIVTLDSRDRFGQTATLISSGWAKYEAWLAAGLPASARDRLDLP